MSTPAVLHSVTCHGVGTLIAIISQLNTLPACAPVNASMAASRLATHDSGSGWLAMPFLCDSFIHYSTPVLSRRTTRAAKRYLAGSTAKSWETRYAENEDSQPAIDCPLAVLP